MPRSACDPALRDGPVVRGGDGHAPRSGRRGRSPPSCSPNLAATGAFDLYHDYTLPVAVTYLADWLGIPPSDVTYGVDELSSP